LFILIESPTLVLFYIVAFIQWFAILWATEKIKLKSFLLILFLASGRLYQSYPRADRGQFAFWAEWVVGRRR